MLIDQVAAGFARLAQAIAALRTSAAVINDELEPGDTGADAACLSIDGAHASIKRLRFDVAQTLTPAQRLQACQNAGLGNPDTDLLTYYLTGD